MPFAFLKYLQPTHYFRLVSHSGLSIFPKPEYFSDLELEVLSPDTNYDSELASYYDLSWQAIQAGYIGDVSRYQHFESVSVMDNYRFIRKNFHKAWVWYVLVLRVCSLYNPFKEFRAFFLTRSVNRQQSIKHPIKLKDYNTFQSALIATQPLVSIVIPTLNRYAFLQDILKDLEKQTYTHFEVLIVDQSDVFQPDFYKSYNLDIQLIRQEEKALWLARNTAIKQAKGDLIALSEDDVRVRSNWLETHLKCLDFFKAEVSAGVFYPEGKDIPKDRSFFAIATQFATGNALLYKSVFKKVGLFDRQFEKQRMGDGEFGLRVYLAGLKSVSNPLASCLDVKASTGGLREMGSWDAFRPSKYFAPRPIPSVLYYFRRYYGSAAARWALLRTIPISIFPYQFKKNKALMVVGLLITLLLFPIVCFQVLKSWHLASIKLKIGPLIEEFE
ncbi:glycosyltransferase family 2 protein [Hanstruepera flava]|uniref:glycosyltransferase family 2 protein n=1 Tax=Hanstruepera flava TaxID=2930218 RepID=UPI002029020F|nr:glycosyltransferase family A protein [Hanstruepera flava]